MRRNCFLICVVLLGCWPRLLGAQQSKNVEPARYSLEGVVINSITDQPIPRALVTIGETAALTGSDGRFKFSGVPAGPTGIRVTKPGFYHNRAVNYTFGRRVATVSYEIGRPVIIGPETPVLKLALTPTSVITGTVQDSEGGAIEGATVNAIQPVVVDGHSLQQVATANTDENGHFRIANLQPGHYYVSVLPGTYRRSLADFSEGQNTGYPAVVYYPVNPDRVSALPLEVKAGGKLELPFELKKVPVFKVSGSVSGASNKSSVPVQLNSEDGVDTYFSTVTKPETTFDFNAVPAGHYLLRAGTGPRTEVSLNVERNIKDLSVVLHPAISAPLRVRTEFTRNNPFLSMQTGKVNLGLVSVIAHAVSGNQEDVTDSLDVPKDGGLQLHLWPGKYFFEFTPALGYVYSARCGSTDLLREPLTTANPMPPIEVTLRDDTGSLTVKFDSTGKYSRTTLLVISELPGVRPRAIPLSDGSAEVNLPQMAPGQYSLFAFDPIDQIEYRRPDALNEYAAKASHVTVRPNNPVTASVEVIHTAE